MLGSIWLAWFAVVMLIMLYGVIRYPYPIHYRDDGYFNTVDQHVTEQQFRDFKVWERYFLGAFAVLATLSIPLALAERRRRMAR